MSICCFVTFCPNTSGSIQFLKKISTLAITSSQKPMSGIILSKIKMSLEFHSRKLHNVKLCLDLVVVSMAPVQCYLIPIFDKTESLVSSTQAQVNFVLLAVWALKFTVNVHSVNSYLLLSTDAVISHSRVGYKIVLCKVHVYTFCTCAGISHLHFSIVQEAVSRILTPVSMEKRTASTREQDSDNLKKNRIEFLN